RDFHVTGVQTCALPIYSYASEDKSNYQTLIMGDFSYNKSYSTDYPFGAIKRLDKYEKGIVSPLYICFRPKDATCSDFYVNYFESDRKSTRLNSSHVKIS